MYQGGFFVIRALPTELSHKSCGSGTRTHDIGLRRTKLLGFAETALMCGWGGSVRTNACQVQSPMPYHLATPQYSLHLLYNNYIINLKQMQIFLCIS